MCKVFYVIHWCAMDVRWVVIDTSGKRHYWAIDHESAIEVAAMFNMITYNSKLAEDEE